MVVAIKRAGPTPIYQQLKDSLRQRILSGVWPPHFKLQAEVDLAADLGVSRGTVRKAIEDLIAEGLLVRIHGRGTFVASPALEQPLAEHLVAFSEQLLRNHIAFETEVIEQALTTPPERVASLLDLSPREEVLSLKRLRLVGGRPLTLLHNYVNISRCAGIETLDFTHERLFQSLEERYGLRLDWGRRFFEAQNAGEETARLLDVPPGAAVMYLEQLVYLDDGSPIELSDVWLRGDRFRLSAAVKRKAAAAGPRSLAEYWGMNES
jgi:DNA-binding GntR family transcriptional regulator